MLIRPLSAQLDLAAVGSFYGEAADYWILADRRPPNPAKVASFFTDAPPGVDPATSQHLGIYHAGGRLCGVAVLSFGFPAAGDAYFDLLLLAPYLRGQGHGATVVRAVEARARSAGARQLYLAVLAANPRGRAFWEREGFQATGHSGVDPDTGHLLYRLGKAL